MQISSLFVVLTALASGTFASPVAQDDGVVCTAVVRDCFADSCDPVFANPNDLSGTCTNNNKGCDCFKCSVESNVNCSKYQCVGVFDEASGDEVCSSGKYQGCPCFNGIIP